MQWATRAMQGRTLAFQRRKLTMRGRRLAMQRGKLALPGSRLASQGPKLVMQTLNLPRQTTEPARPCRKLKVRRCPRQMRGRAGRGWPMGLAE